MGGVRSGGSGKQGEVLFAAVRRRRAWWPAEVAEGKAVAMAARLARRLGYVDVIFECDCQVLVNKLSQEVLYSSDLDNVLEDVMSLCSDFNSVSWSHVKRNGNVVAHHLAKINAFRRGTNLD